MSHTFLTCAHCEQSSGGRRLDVTREGAAGRAGDQRRQCQSIKKNYKSFFFFF